MGMVLEVGVGGEGGEYVFLQLRAGIEMRPT